MTSKIVYQGALRTTAEHIKSSTKIITDAPTDNHGRGEAFSPTDLIASALASCMLTIMGIVANRHNLNIQNTSADVTKVMDSNPRRISKVIVAINLPHNDLSDSQKQLLENAALSCPVAKSLSSDLTQEITFNYPK